MIYWIAWLILAPLVCLLWPTRIIGKKYKKIVKGESALFCSNHQTMNDPIIYKVRVKPTLKIMAKSSIFKNKFFGWFLRKCGAYPVGRGENDIEAVKTTLGYLKNDKQILIFPEGTRVKHADSMNMKTGLVTFALKTDSYIVPTYFRKITKVFVFNTLVVGKPFKFSDLEEFKGKKPDKELIAKANEILSEKMNYLKTVNIKEYRKQIKEDLKNCRKK